MTDDFSPRAATRADHQDDSYGSCVVCRTWQPHTDDDYDPVDFPCAVVREDALLTRIAALEAALLAALEA